MYNNVSIHYICSNFEAFINIVESVIGTGIYAMPKAFYNSGWINGIISNVVISFITLVSMNMLVRLEIDCSEKIYLGSILDFIHVQIGHIQRNAFNILPRCNGIFF